MKESVRELMQRFSLEPLEDNLFRGQSEANGQRSIFGGLVAGQALLAASMTVPAERPVHSLHAYFLRPGDIRRPVIYDVDRIRDGKSFTTRRVNAIQHGRPIFSLAASFQVEEEGARHQAPMPEVPAPEELETDEQARLRMADRIPKQFRDDFLRERPLSFRPVTPATPSSRNPGAGQALLVQGGRHRGSGPHDPAGAARLLLRLRFHGHRHAAPRHDLLAEQRAVRQPRPHHVVLRRFPGRRLAAL